MDTHVLREALCRSYLDAVRYVVETGLAPNVSAIKCNEKLIYYLARRATFGAERNPDNGYFYLSLYLTSRDQNQVFLRSVDNMNEIEKAAGINGATEVVKIDDWEIEKGRYCLTYKVVPAQHWFSSFPHFSLYVFMLRDYYRGNILREMPAVNEYTCYPFNLGDIQDIFSSPAYAERLQQKHASTGPYSIWRGYNVAIKESIYGGRITLVQDGILHTISALNVRRHLRYLLGRVQNVDSARKECADSFAEAALNSCDVAELRRLFEDVKAALRGTMYERNSALFTQLCQTCITYIREYNVVVKPVIIELEKILSKYEIKL